MLTFVFISFHHQHQHYKLHFSKSPFSPFKIKVYGLQIMLCSFSNLIHISYIMSHSFFSVKIQFHINENPILPNFRHSISTFINARKGIVCFLPPPSDSFRRAFSRLPDPCASIYSYIWSDPHRQFASIMIHFRKSFGFFVWLIVF